MRKGNENFRNRESSESRRNLCNNIKNLSFSIILKMRMKYFVLLEQIIMKYFPLFFLLFPPSEPMILRDFPSSRYEEKSWKANEAKNKSWGSDISCLSTKHKFSLFVVGRSIVSNSSEEDAKNNMKKSFDSVRWSWSRVSLPEELSVPLKRLGKAKALKALLIFP